jgi:tripartite-type tricarboxylate transporter receptor subunit TctC
MRFILLLALCFFNVNVQADNTIKVFCGSGPTCAEFVQHLKKIKAIGVYKYGNDGDAALTEALSTPNSFFIAYPDSHLLHTKFKKDYNDPFKQTDVVADIVRMPMAVAVKYGSPFNTMEELVAAAKKENRPLLLGGGIQSFGTCQMTGVFISHKYNIDVNYVYYKPGIQSAADLMNDRIDMLCRYGDSIYNSVENKQAKLIMKMTSIDDGALKGLPVGFANWGAGVLVTSKNTSPAIKQQMIDALNDPEYINSVSSLKLKHVYYTTNTDITSIIKYMNGYEKFIDEHIKIDKRLQSLYNQAH